MTEDERVTAATEGTAFTSATGPDDQQVLYTVGPSCGENHGRWHCITHDEGFTNNLMKDHHIDPPRRNGKRHVMVWICFDHGPEQP